MGGGRGGQAGRLQVLLDYTSQQPSGLLICSDANWISGLAALCSWVEPRIEEISDSARTPTAPRGLRKRFGPQSDEARVWRGHDVITLTVYTHTSPQQQHLRRLKFHVSVLCI